MNNFTKPLDRSKFTEELLEMFDSVMPLVNETGAGHVIMTRHGKVAFSLDISTAPENIAVALAATTIPKDLARIELMEVFGDYWVDGLDKVLFAHIEKNFGTASWHTLDFPALFLCTENLMILFTDADAQAEAETQSNQEVFAIPTVLH